jgi:hypothetical protein
MDSIWNVKTNADITFDLNAGSGYLTPFDSIQPGQGVYGASRSHRSN